MNENLTTEKFQEYQIQMEKIFPKNLINNHVIYLCIGTDRSCGDSLGPMIGTMLIEVGYDNVYGTLDDPVHAANLEDVIKTLPKDKVVIAIDACLGQLSSIGKISIHKGHVKPGAGVNKELPAVGDYAITGIVNVGGFMEYFVLQNTRLSLVKEMANMIFDLIQHRFPIQLSESYLDSSSFIRYISYLREKLGWVAGQRSITEEQIAADLRELENLESK